MKPFAPDHRIYFFGYDMLIQWPSDQKGVPLRGVFEHYTDKFGWLGNWKPWRRAGINMEVI